MHKLQKFLILVLGRVLLAASGCVKGDLAANSNPLADSGQKPSDQEIDEIKSEDQAAQLWQEYLAIAPGRSVEPFRFEGSLRYSDPDNRGHRVSYYLWSNGEYPYRMDATAGFGSVVISVMEGEKEFLAYVPEENAAYAYKGFQTPRFALPGLGQPLPLTVSNIAELLQGRFSCIFDSEYSLSADADRKKYPALDRNFTGKVYVLLRGPFAGELVLDSFGRPAFWQEQGGNGWSIKMNYAEDPKGQPLHIGSPELDIHKLTIAHAKNYNAVLYAKERSFPKERFSDSQLTLIIPSGVEMRPIKQLR